jgi:hypothetical protein
LDVKGRDEGRKGRREHCKKKKKKTAELGASWVVLLYKYSSKKKLEEKERDEGRKGKKKNKKKKKKETA